MRIKSAVFLALVPAFLSSASQVRAQLAADHSSAWKAQWIAAPGAPQRDEVVLHFRKVIELPAPPQHFYVDVSADNQFIFHVNQRRVGSGPSRGDLGHWRYETYDLGPFLRPGKNVLAATVWNFATHAPIAQMSDRVAFLVHGQGSAERMADSDSSWEVEVEKGLRSLPPQLNGYYAAEPGIRIDGAVFDWSWDSEEASLPGSWHKVVPLGRGALKGESDPPNNWQLVKDALPLMEMRLVPAGKVVRAEGIALPSGFPEQAVTVPAHSKASILIDNTALTTAYPALTASGGPGSTMHLTYAEALVDAAGQKGSRDQIAGKHIEGLVDEFAFGSSGSREFMPLAWRTWRYLQIDVQAASQPVRLKSLKTWFTAYPFVERAAFASDDPSLHSIWDIGWRTARLDAHDTYMDTPYWERLQYVGDTRIQALISYTMAGDDRLARQAIQAFNDSRIPEGLTQSRYPSSLVQIIPTFSLLWVGMVHDFWLYRGDAAFVRAQLPGTRDVLGWYLDRQRADGLMGKVPWWPFVDWGKDFVDGVPPQEDDGGSAVITLQFVAALRDAAEIETALGDPRTAATYRDAATRAAAAVRKLCRSDQYGLIADTPAHRHYSQHANILAVWLDVVLSDQQKDVLEKILSTSDSGFHASTALPPMTAATYYFRFYLARALLHAGMGDQYLQLLGPWQKMVSLGLTTWAESPEPTRSDSHAWSAHPNFDFLTIVAGIRPASAGFESVAIEPHLGALNHVEAALPTPKGMVEVKYRRVSNRIEAQIDLPAGMTGALTWKGQQTILRQGEQTLVLP
ncbi:MAG TPA: alpha-L-rhamnosidase C-terminal domain-containing protein [Candidatus Sulfotelmatobacter sp.]|nr:alpha-L-rhamnosidase C-terminal domain-containing protein [Candidatus Sulfotelmatobacter sp.]